MTEDEIRQDCWQKAFYSEGTAQVFRDRGNATERKLRVLAFLGIAVPAVVGSAVAGFGAAWAALPAILILATLLGTAQLVGSIWAEAARWPETLAFSAQSAAENTLLRDDFQSLGRNPPTDLALHYDRARMRYQQREILDNPKLSLKDRRRGYRWASYYFRKECSLCKKVPEDMKSTACERCGMF